MNDNNRMETHCIAAQHAGMTVEEYLKTEALCAARRRQSLTRAKGALLLNGRPTFLARALQEGDCLQIRRQTDGGYGVIPAPGPLDILYEDDALLVVNKPPFQLVHPAGNTRDGTLANALAGEFQRRGVLCAIRPLHRLDRGTSGCVVFAKTARSQTQLAQQLADGRLKRRYRAVVAGCVTPPAGTINAPIAKDPAAPNRRRVHTGGEAAVTHYRTLRSGDGQSLLELSLETGRTHQIRVHLAHAGHPIIGDRMYGRRSPLISRQALHAAEITCVSPAGNRLVTVCAPLPEDMRALLEVAGIVP